MSQRLIHPGLDQCGCTHLNTIGRHHGHLEVAVGIHSDDRFVVSRNSPGEGHVGGGNAREGVTPGEPSVLTIDDKGELEVTHAWWTGNGLRARVMGVVAEDDGVSLT